jgi:NADH:ubiquinone oxidoreductase subunit E
VDLLSELTRTLEIDVGATTADRLFTLETVECLGLCEMAPAMMIDDVSYGNLSGDKIRHIIGSLRKRKGRHGQGGR